MTADLVTPGGDVRSVELVEQWSTRQLSLGLTLENVLDCSCDCGGCDHHGDEYLSLELERHQVVELRDRLDAWLQRGEP